MPAKVRWHQPVLQWVWGAIMDTRLDIKRTTLIIINNCPKSVEYFIPITILMHHVYINYMHSRRSDLWFMFNGINLNIRHYIIKYLPLIPQTSIGIFKPNQSC